MRIDLVNLLESGSRPSPSLLAEWRVGAILEAVAVRDARSSQLWLDIGGQRHPARLASGDAAGPQNGERLQVRVLRNSPVLALETVSTQATDVVAGIGRDCGSAAQVRAAATEPGPAARESRVDRTTQERRGDIAASRRASGCALVARAAGGRGTRRSEGARNRHCEIRCLPRSEPRRASRSGRSALRHRSQDAHADAAASAAGPEREAFIDAFGCGRPCAGSDGARAAICPALRARHVGGARRSRRSS